MKAKPFTTEEQPKLNREQVIDLLARKKIPSSVARIMELAGRSKQEARTDIKEYERRYVNTNVTPYIPAEVPPEAERSAVETVEKPQDIPKEKRPIQWNAIARSAREKLMALGIAGLGAWLAWLQLGINFDFWRSIGQSSGAADKFGYIGYIIDVLGFTLGPSRQLLLDGGKTQSSFLVWLTALALFFCLAASTYASSNFAASNVNTAESRQRTIAQQITRLEKERDQIAKSQLDSVQRNRLRAADWAAIQIKSYDEQIRELRKQALVSLPDLLNSMTWLFYAALPALCSLLFMVAYTIAFRHRQ